MTLTSTEQIKGDPIFYRKNSKYQLARKWWIDLNLFLAFPGLEYDVLNDFIHLTRDGHMYFEFGYAWDGCSGPTVDDDTNMRAGLIHDGLYQLMREGLLPGSFRDYADKILKNVCLADGMDPLRAEMYHKGVDLFAGKYAEKGHDTYPEQTAPVPVEHQKNNGFGFGPPFQEVGG